MLNWLKYSFLIAIVLLATFGDVRSQTVTNGVNADNFQVMGDFASPVPLLVFNFDYSDKNATSNTVIVSIFNNEKGLNRLTDTPVASYKLLFEEDSGINVKKTYHLMLESEENTETALVGLPLARQWTLRGSDRDKSMLRNYLALQMAAQLDLPQVPKGHLCEVVYKEGDAFYYQGVYLLSEYIRNGVFMSDKAVNDKVCIVRFVLNRNIKERQFIYELVKYNTDIAPEVAVMDFVNLEQTLNLNDGLSFFYGYDKLHVSTFLDTFLLYNGLANYREDLVPVYFYKDAQGRIGVSPLWDFDECLDNGQKAFTNEVEPYALYPWFDRLMEYNNFNTELRKSFFDLDKKAFNILKLQAAVDKLAKDLGPALERDWMRWDEAYNASQPEMFWWHNAEERLRSTRTPVEEVIKMRYMLRAQNTLMKDLMESLQWKKVTFTESNRSTRVLVFTIGFIALFFFIVAFSRRKF